MIVLIQNFSSQMSGSVPLNISHLPQLHPSKVTLLILPSTGRVCFSFPSIQIEQRTHFG